MERITNALNYIKELSFSKKVSIVMVIVLIVIGVLMYLDMTPPFLSPSSVEVEIPDIPGEETPKTWTPVDQTTFMCSEGNLDDGYNENDHNDLDNWKKHDTPYHGWRWCGVTVNQCKASCIAAGDCTGIHYTPNKCCFPLRSSCIDKTANSVGGTTDESVPEAGRYELV